jgi:hypothetical protein
VVNQVPRVFSGNSVAVYGDPPLTRRIGDAGADGGMRS